MFLNQQFKMGGNYQNRAHAQREDNFLASLKIILHKLVLFATYKQTQLLHNTMLHLMIYSQPSPIAMKMESHPSNNFKIGKTFCVPGPNSFIIPRILTPMDNQSFLLLLWNGLTQIYQVTCVQTNPQPSVSRSHLQRRMNFPKLKVLLNLRLHLQSYQFPMKQGLPATPTPMIMKRLLMQTMI